MVFEKCYAAARSLSRLHQVHHHGLSPSHRVSRSRRCQLCDGTERHRLLLNQTMTKEMNVLSLLTMSCILVVVIRLAMKVLGNMVDVLLLSGMLDLSSSPSNTLFHD